MSPYRPVAGTPGRRGAARERERDDAVGGQRAARVAGQPHGAGGDVGLLVADELDAGRVERTRDGRARLAAEEFERLLLRGHQRDANRIAVFAVISAAS